MEFIDLGNGKTGFDIIFEETDQDLVKVELDCYWATYSGVDPHQVIQAYNGRVVSLHMKDMAIENGQKRSIELGRGSLDIQALQQTGEEANVSWFVIEQEQFDGDPLVAAEENVVNWNKIIK